MRACSAGLSQRAGHPEPQLKLLHGSLFDVKCSSFFCDYFERDNFTDPIVPALAIPTDGSDPTAAAAPGPSAAATTTTPSGPARELDISDVSVHIPALTREQLPKCPACPAGVLRPGVVWFGEALPAAMVDAADEWIAGAPRIDLILVVGTSSSVYPAAAYIDEARRRGARLAVVNMSKRDAPAGGLRAGDWFFEGDASEILPVILKGLIGEL